MDSKEELRQLAKKLRKNITNKELKEKLITKNLLNNKIIKNREDILVYISKDDEVNTINFIKELLRLKKNVYAPVVKGCEINFFKINSLNELKLSNLGILEPTTNCKFINKTNSVCIVPGLFFDKHNNRLGYGGGYYDRFFSKNDIYKIGICFSSFLLDEITTQEFDIKMDLVITELG